MSAKTRRKALDAVTKYAIQSFDKIKVLSSKVPTGGFIGGEILLGRLINGYMTDRALDNGASSSSDWNKEVVVVTRGSGASGQRSRSWMCGRLDTQKAVFLFSPFSVCKSVF